MHRKSNASWLGIWSPLGTDLAGFGRQVGSQVGAKLDQSPSQNQSETAPILCLIFYLIVDGFGIDVGKSWVRSQPKINAKDIRGVIFFQKIDVRLGENQKSKLTRGLKIMRID